MGERGAVTPDIIRPWIVLGVAVILIVAALFISKDPTTLMLGCTLLGTEPLARAKKEPPPEAPKVAVPA